MISNSDLQETSPEKLALELNRFAAHSNTIPFTELVPLLRKLLLKTEDSRYSPYSLLCLLLARPEPEASALALRFHAAMMAEALRKARSRQADPAIDWSLSPLLAHLPQEIPVGWRSDTMALAALRQAVQLQRDLAFLQATAPDMAGPLRAVAAALESQLALLRTQDDCWSLLPLSQLWSDLAFAPDTALPPSASRNPQAEEEAHLAELAARATAVSDCNPSPALKELVAWPSAAVAPYLRQVCAAAPARQAFVMQALALRTRLEYSTWSEWLAWLQRMSEAYVQFRADVAALAETFQKELRLLWLRQQADGSDPALVAVVEAAVLHAAQHATPPAEFVRRWEHALTPAEASRFTGGLPPPALAKLPPVLAKPPPMLTKPAPMPVPTSIPAPLKTAPVHVAAVRPPPKPTVWDSHIQPFLAANWYIIAGLLMVVAGASVLAYFTWDKSAFVRYLFLPLLLGAFTGGLAELGLRLSRRHEELRVTGTFLLGGAICLLPVNFMVLCRAGADPLAARLILPALGLYAVLAGLGLWRWCGAMRPELRLLLGLPLLAVNLLAVLGDMPGLRDVATAHSALLLPITITSAVFLLLVATNRFLWRVLDAELLASKRVPWFFGITLAATTIQVAAWRHFHLGLAPQPQDYALAAILIGVTLLRWERRACELRNTGAAYGGESFLGYAALLLGILMAAGHEWLRLVALLLTGLIWLVQAPRRPGVAHYWIGVTLCLLAGASVGMLHGFPKSRELNLLPELGLALALAAGALRALSGRRGEARLRQVALEIQPPILLLTAIITVLSQYHLRSAPWQSGLVLLAVAIFFAVRATREERLDWLHISAAAAGLSLPYLGCADMIHYRFGSNTLALGFGALSAVWLTASRLLPGQLWRSRGAFITTCFGGLGLFGLCLRLLLANFPEISSAELAGGALLAMTLVIAAWYSRSQIPSMMAAVLLAVILPLFRVPAGAMPAVLYVGSGLVSAAIALALTLGCFVLRREELRRNISGLFTTPVWASVFWLSAKALGLQFQAHPVPLPFTVAMLLLASTAYVAALFFRERTAGSILFHMSWPLLGMSTALACEAAGCHGAGMVQYPLLWTGVALTTLLGAEVAAARRWTWAQAFLVRPRLALLTYGSAAVALLIVISVLGRIYFYRPHDLQWLELFLAMQLVWHSLRCSQRRFGAVLFLLAIAWLSGLADLFETFGNLSIFLLSPLLADIVLEFIPKPRVFLNSLRAPFLAGATILSVVLSGALLFSVRPVNGDVLNVMLLQRADIMLLFVTLLLAARAQACAGLALPAAALAYLLLLLPCDASTLFQPWRLALLALVFCLLPFLGRLLAKRQQRSLFGWGPQIPDVASGPQAPWFIVPGLALASGAAALQVMLSSAGQSDVSQGVQILAPFATVAAFALAGTYWRRGVLWGVAECLLPVANVFAIAVLWGQTLLSHQLMPVHIIGMAAVLTLAELAAVRQLVLQVWRPPLTEAAQWLHRGCAALAGVTLVLLGMNYITDPDLAQIPVRRFLVSGLLALGAGVYFRAAARRPEHLRTSEGTVMESLWHVALGLALWCGALMIPALRTPHAALYVLALPAVACWLTAEVFLKLRTSTERNLLTGDRFCTSAIAFAVLVLVLYLFRLPFQLVLFPKAPLGLNVYHTGAAAPLLMGLILLRLRGLCNAPWVALSGGLALIPGVYFLVTWLPGLSPFAFPMAGAWTAIVAAHLLMLLSYQQSPLRSFIQYIGGIGAEEWHAHRRQCGLFLLAATHVAVLAGLLQGTRTHSADLTPLLAALPSVLVHHILLGVPWANAYRLIAAVELLVALHIDFLLPKGVAGLIPARQVVWFLLASWLGATIFWQRVKRPLDVRVIWAAAGWLAVLCGGHLFYHGPATGSGLLIAAAMALAVLLTQVPEETPAARPLALLTLAVPLWLAYFGTRWLTGDGLLGFRPLFATISALLGMGMLVRRVDKAVVGAAARASCRRLAHEVLSLCERNSEALARAFLGAVFAGLALLTFLHGDARHGSLGLMLSLAFAWGLSGAAWFREGQLRDGSLPYTLSVLSLAGAWIVLRRLLFQHFNFWTYEYDIWLSLGASLAFSAAKRIVQHKQPGLARTMTGTVWLLPVLQCVWLVSNRMSADLTLLVIGIQAILFAWHGGGKKDSPYNAISVLGFVGFVCLLFWTKLDLRCVQAYTIPCGLGVLGLVWLFGEHMTSALRTAVRFITVSVMLGSCGYYALLDNTVGFHLTMLVLCLVVMALGPLLRVQIYLYIGFTGFATDLVAIVVKQFQALDRSIQMMGIGALLLLLGIAVVGGAILYKTRHEAILAFANKVRGKLGKWE